MIFFNTFFTESMNTVDAVISNFVHATYVNLIQANSDVITLSFTLYVMFIGYQFISHHHHFQMGDVIKRLILMLCVFGLVMNWQLYHLFVYNIFTNEPAAISQVLVGAAGDGHFAGSIATTLDSLCESIVNAAVGFWGQVSFSTSGLSFLFYGVLVIVIGGLMIVYALLLFIYAKMMMAVSLALGPVFVLFIMWNPTKGLFSAWLNKLITIALIPIITSAVLSLMLSVISVTLPQLNQPSDQMQFVGIFPFLGLSLATVMILSQVIRISSSLGGGIAIAGLSTGAEIVSSAWNKLGVPKATNRLGTLGSYKSTNVYQNRGSL